MFTLIISDCILIGALKKLILLSRSVPVIKIRTRDDSLNNMFVCMAVFVCLHRGMTRKGKPVLFNCYSLLSRLTSLCHCYNKCVNISKFSGIFKKDL